MEGSIGAQVIIFIAFITSVFLAIYTGNKMIRKSAEEYKKEREGQTERGKLHNEI